MPGCKIMVCVTGQKTCERLIREGARIADEQGGSVHVVHVAMQNSAFLSSGVAQDAEALEYLFRCAQSCSAEISVLRSNDALKTLTKFARNNGISHIVLGVAAGRNGSHFADSLSAALPQVHVMPIFADIG